MTGAAADPTGDPPIDIDRADLLRLCDRLAAAVPTVAGLDFAVGWNGCVNALREIAAQTDEATP